MHIKLHPELRCRRNALNVSWCYKSTVQYTRQFHKYRHFKYIDPWLLNHINKTRNVLLNTSLVHFWPPPIFNSGHAYAFDCSSTGATTIHTLCTWHTASCLLISLVFDFMLLCGSNCCISCIISYFLLFLLFVSLVLACFFSAVVLFGGSQFNGLVLSGNREINVMMMMMMMIHANTELY